MARLEVGWAKVENAKARGDPKAWCLENYWLGLEVEYRRLVDAEARDKTDEAEDGVV